MFVEDLYYCFYYKIEYLKIVVLVKKIFERGFEFWLRRSVIKKKFWFKIF